MRKAAIEKSIANVIVSPTITPSMRSMLTAGTDAGDPGRVTDYQIWCGPAMGAFNEWARGSHLEAPANRTVVGVALNLLYGACVILRRAALRQQGVALPEECFPLAPLATDEVALRV